MYVIVEAGGKQYRVEEGTFMRVELMNAAEGDTVILDKVLAVSVDGEMTFGAPFVEGASVSARVKGHGKQDKVIIFKYRRKKNYRRFKGHRQNYTDLVVESIKA